MDCDGRVQALRGRPVVYDSYTNEDGAVGVLNRLSEIREQCAKHRRAPFHTLICPDSFSGFCEFAIADALDIIIQGNKDVKDRKDKKGQIKGDLQMTTFDEYRYEAEAVRQLLFENLLDIKKYAHVIVTAHEVTKYKMIPPKTPNGLATREEDGLRVLATDKISAKLPTKFDEIYHFMGKEVVHSLKTVRRTVCFQGQLGRSSYPQLNQSTLPHDITGKEFYPYWASLINPKKDEVPLPSN